MVNIFDFCHGVALSLECKHSLVSRVRVCISHSLVGGVYNCNTISLSTKKNIIVDWDATSLFLC